MERAWNSDSETHVKKYNRTSGAYLSLKSLWDIFLGHPVDKFKMSKDIKYDTRSDDQIHQYHQNQ